MEPKLLRLLRSLGCFLAPPIFLAALFSCQAPSSGGGTPGSASLHALHSKQLRGVMNDISGVASERLPAELGNIGGGDPNLMEVARAASALTQSASRISSAVDSVSLEPKERKKFLSLARKLKTQSSNLQAQARAGDASSARLAMRRVNSTCNSCHSLFRDSGPSITLVR